MAGNAFNNSGKIHDLRSPLLIIHGTRDEIIPFGPGRELFDLAPEPKAFAAIEGAGDNDISLAAGGRCWDTIEQWVNN